MPRMSGAMSVRRKGRERAFQMLFGLSFAQSAGLAHLSKTFKNLLTVTDEEPPEDESSDFSWLLVGGVMKHRDDLDAVIGRFSQHWKIERIARVELAILRLALFEILHVEDIPLKVAINEAVELAKLYGDENSRNFVNGILDAVARAVDKGEFKIKKTF
jgi:N utilization substance protein B